jgi:hypothetical protein
MTIVRRRLVYEGRVEFAALLLPETSASRARLLREWQRGVVIRSTTEGLLVRFPAPRELDAEVMQGIGLVEREGVLVAAPFDAAALKAVQARPGSVVLARGSRPFLVRVTGAEIDPSTWLELPAFELLSPPPTPPLALALAPAPAARPIDLRPDPAALPPEAARIVSEALRSAAPSAPSQPLARQLLTRVLRWWRNRRERRRALPERAAAPSALTRLNGWLDERLQRTAIGRWFEDFNRTYVDRLLDMFEREALDDALKHAVPLSRKTAAPGTPEARLPYSARTSVAINFGAARSGTGPATVMAAGVYETLKQRYRAAAEKLEKAGRIEEAAFVLADLLDAPQEAVDLFERHGRFDIAARLSEARALPAELSVRLWVLAKDLPRAVALARRHRVFGAAVARLDMGRHPEARGLRLEWADWLATTGDFGGAVHAATPVPEARRLILEWIDRGIEAGGTQRAALLIKRLELEPATSTRYASQAQAVLESRDEATAAARAELAEALGLATDPASKAIRRPLERAAIRALVRDEAALGVSNPGVLSKLLAEDEGPLRVDVPPFAPGVRPVSSPSARFERVATALTPYDAVPLPSGALLVALGESGVALVARDGTVKWRAEVPAHALVVSEEGANALALTQREDVWSISKISLAPKKAARWADVQFSRASATYADGTWFVAHGQRIVGLDVTGAQPVALWEIDLPGAQVRALAATATRVAAIVADPALRYCVWQLPSFSLESSFPLLPAEQVNALALTAERQAALFARGNGRAVRAWTLPATAGQPAPEQHVPGELSGTPSCDTGCFAVPVRWREEVPDQLDVLVRPGQVSLAFGHATSATTRFHRGRQLVVCCDNGQVVCFDVARQRVVSALSVKP